MADPEYELRTVPNDHQTQSNVPKTASGSQVPRSLSPRSSITAREPATTRLYYILWPLFVFVFYAAIALTPWIMLCIMSKRPLIGSKDYYDIGTYADYKDLYRANEERFRAARILQSIAALFTIPITTAICSMACVTYMQSGKLRKSLTLRKAMALADQGWLSPRIWIHLVKTGSLPLYIALGLTLVGSVSQILQNAFVTQENLIGSGSGDSVLLTDVPDLVRTSSGVDMLVNQLRSLLESTMDNEYDVNLWGNTTNPIHRTFYEVFRNDEYQYEEDPYFAPLPFNFSTGAYAKSQYAPRLNSSLQFVNISTSDWVKGCPGNQTSNGSFYARYDHVLDEQFWFNVEACMTGDQRISPWKPVRDRQDITEELYLGIGMWEGLKEPYYYRITVNSTLGYFELPSHRNGNRPGPLLQKDPLTDDQDGLLISKRDSNVSYAGNSTLMQTNNKGPLTTLALALFGPGSFIETRMSRPSAFILQPSYFVEGRPWGDGNCVTLRPFDLMDHWSQSCVFDYNSFTEHRIYDGVYEWLKIILNGGASGNRDVMFRTGLYLANKLWLGDKHKAIFGQNLWVYYDDEGVPTFKPKISDAGIIVGSVLLGMHLLGLMLLALYACVMKPWVGRMGSVVMVKMGVVYADVLARAETKEQFKKAVDALPGFIGDDRPGENVGRMRIGAESGLSRRGQRMFEVLR